jgi:hypothetical protein
MMNNDGSFSRPAPHSHGSHHDQRPLTQAARVFLVLPLQRVAGRAESERKGLGRP